MSNPGDDLNRLDLGLPEFQAAPSAPSGSAGSPSSTAGTAGASGDSVGDTARDGAAAGGEAPKTGKPNDQVAVFVFSSSTFLL
jgi:hypothetical protein